MNAEATFEGKETDTEQKTEIRLLARAVSRGVAIGRAVCLYGSRHQFYRSHLPDNAVAAEVKRLHRAIGIARKALSQLSARKNGSVTRSAPGIFEAQLALLDDPLLRSGIEDRIASEKVNAEWSIKSVTDEYVVKLTAGANEHLRDRHIDLEDVSDRILASLESGPGLTLPFGSESIVVAQELRPSTIVELTEQGPLGFITENGGWTSHSFILAREMGRPAVTGVREALRRIDTGDRVIVDGYNGQVILNPSDETLKRCRKPDGVKVRDARKRTSPEQPLRTLDGRKISIFANADEPTAFAWAKEMGAEGIGLFRSEFLFSRLRRFPTEAQQLDAYRAIAEATGAGGVRIRTFDISSDRSYIDTGPREPNPALGLRGIRFSLAHRGHLRSQVRSLLRASYAGKIDVILPMVSGIAEIRAVREALENEGAYLISKGKKIGSPKLGVMIEVPSALLVIDELVQEADFLCLGTNDLIQYLLAADRDNHVVSNWYQTLHPAVLRAISSVLSSAARVGKSVSVCGEMAGSPYYVPLLIGLGATELSMNPTSIRGIRRIVTGIAAEEAEALAQSVEQCRTAHEVEQALNLQIQKNWRHLFPKDFRLGRRTR